jgi:Carboxypeptidase regulatory-like domain/TonB dependent receptor
MSVSRFFSHIIIALALTLVVTSAAHAQYRAGIQGTVLDSQGAVVDGAKVTVTAQETGIAQQTLTGDSGVFSVTRLAPGLYRISTEKAGFKTKVVENVNIIGDQVTSVNVTLEVGQVTESVTVNGAQLPAIDTESGQIQGTITAQQVQAFPSFGRDVFQLLQLAPGAFGDGSRNSSGDTFGLPSSEQSGSGATDGIFKTENQGQITAGGTRNNQNNYTIDGVGVTSVSWGGASVVTPNEDSVKEVKVISDNYDAEYGRYAGGQVQVISANGTNEYHGSAFISIHRPGLNAYNSWGGPFGGAPQRNTSDFNQIGGSIGGPILKNKLFFFFTYETIRNDSTGTGTGWYETPQFLSMAPTGSNAARFLTFPGTGVSASSVVNVPCSTIGLVQGANCNEIPGKGLDIGSPLTTPLGTPDPTYQSQTNPGVGNGLDGIPDIMFVNTVQPSTVTNVQYHGRLDWNVTNRDLVAFSIYDVPVSSSFYNGPARPMNYYHHDAINQAGTLLWDHTFSPTFINEARGNAGGWRWNEITSNPQEPWGLPNANIDNIGSAGPQNFGAPGPSVFDQWTYGVKDTLTKVMNSHTLKFGGEFTRLLFVDEAPWSARPSYSFRNYWDFLNDAPYAENGVFDPITGIPTSFRKDTRENIYALFIQDNYKVRPNFTLTLGLRWEYFGPLSEKNGNLGVVQLGATNDTALSALYVRKGGNLFNTSPANFGPQVGFAWSPEGLLGHPFQNKMVVRGGFGMAYGAIEEGVTLNGRNNPPFVSSNSSLTGSSILYQLPEDVHDFNGFPSNPATITNFNGNLLPTTAIVGVTGYSNNMPSTYTYHYSLEGQYDLGHQWLATLGYQGSLTRHLTLQTNLNLLYSPFAALNPVVNNVDWYFNSGNASFNALLAEIQHNFAHTFMFDGQYRYSKCMDDGSNNFAVANYPWIPSTAWGPCDYDATHAVKLFGIWTPRIFRGNDWKEKIIGGWSLSGIFNWHTGFPWSPTYNNIDNQSTCNLVFFNSCNTGGGTNSALLPAAYLGGSGTNYSNSAFKTGSNFPKTGAAYFTAPSFTPGVAFPDVSPIPGPPGIGRNAFRGPRYTDVDATLSKSFGLPNNKILGENSKIEIRANFYNLFNNLNLANVDSTISDPTFGEATTVLGGRTIEMQARFSF